MNKHVLPKISVASIQSIALASFRVPSVFMYPLSPSWIGGAALSLGGLPLFPADTQPGLPNAPLSPLLYSGLKAHYPHPFWRESRTSLASFLVHSKLFRVHLVSYPNLQRVMEEYTPLGDIELHTWHKTNIPQIFSCPKRSFPPSLSTLPPVRGRCHEPI